MKLIILKNYCKTNFSVEEAFDGFMEIQQQQRTAFTQFGQQQQNGGDGENIVGDNSHNAKLRNHVSKVIEELAWHAASSLRNPENSQRLACVCSLIFSSIFHKKKICDHSQIQIQI
jgi:hypothetical protein